MNSKASATEELFQRALRFFFGAGRAALSTLSPSAFERRALELLRRRVLVICLFAWVPLLVLSVLEGHAWGGAVQVPFLLDVHAQARFLVALPLFIIGRTVRASTDAAGGAAVY